MSDRVHDPRDLTPAVDESHERWLEAAAAYALDALDAAEREAFESHLAGCVTCRRAVQEYREVTGLLVHASGPAVAPASLGSRVGRMLAEERASSTAQPAMRDRGWRPSTVWLAAAGVAFAAVSGVLWRQVQQERSRVSAAIEIAARERSSRDSLLANFRGTRVHVVSLAAPSGGSPVARVFWNHERNNYVVTAFGLPRAPQGRTYQLWAVAKGRDPVSMGTFNTDANGVAMVVIPVSETINGMGVIDLCALTEEPAGGSPGPTETPRFAGEWRHTD
jgi:anti-sigma-K factor RskA